MIHQPNCLGTTRWRSVACATALCAVFAFALKTASAQHVSYRIPVQEEWQRELREFVVENYVGLMQPMLTPGEAQRLRNVRFDFPIRTNDQSFNFLSDSTDRVQMPVASLLFFKDLTLSYAWLSVNGYSTMTVLDYVSNLAHGGLARWPQDKRLPRDVLGIPSNAGTDSRVMARYEQHFLDVVLFVLAHELGHILHGFEKPNSKDFRHRRRSEQDADRFALELFRRMNRPPLGVPLFFATTSRLLPAPDVVGARANAQAEGASARTHPLDGERIRAVAQFIDVHRADFAQGFKERNTAPTRLAAMAAELRILAMHVDDFSALRTQADCLATYLPEDLLPRKGNLTEIAPGPSERFNPGPFSGLYEGTVVANKSGQSTALRLVLRRDGNRLTGDTQYLCFRGRVDGEIAGDTAFVRWYVGNIRRSVSLHSEGLGTRVIATWRSDDIAAGGDGTITATRVSSSGR